MSTKITEKMQKPNISNSWNLKITVIFDHISYIMWEEYDLISLVQNIQFSMSYGTHSADFMKPYTILFIHTETIGHYNDTVRIITYLLSSLMLYVLIS